ncbi:MAG: COQ9 family protein, partial [Pseudomonadota bacterium]
LAATDLSGLGVRDKIKTALTLWLGTLAPHKEAVRRAAGRGLLPWAAGDALERTWSVADMAWTGIGDMSDDYNRYSKRGLLASTVPLIVLRWLDEDDPDAMDAYISRRLTQAMQLGQAGGRVAGPLLSALERLRR